MATRIAIELSPDACRIVEIDPAPAWERRRGSTRVRSFAVLPPSGPETDAKLRSLRNRRAAVVVWNAASDCRQIVVSPGSYESMAALQPLLAAGIRVRTAMTPALIAPTAAKAAPTTSRAPSSAPGANQIPPVIATRVPPVAPPAAPIGQEPPRPRARQAPPEKALPFAALLGTILYPPDRKLAIIDGPIVAPGDEVRGARVIDITSGTVTLRDGASLVLLLTINSKRR